MGPLGFRIALLVALLSALAPGQSRSATAQPSTLDGWPRSQKTPQGTLTIFQPQLDSWDGRQIEFHTAASVQPPDEKAPANFGVLEFSAETLVDKMTRLVELDKLRLTRATFPATPSQDDALQAAFQAMLPVKNPIVALDRLEPELAIQGAEKKGQAQPVKNDPPRIVFAEMPAALVHIDGEPAWRPVEKTSLERVINTRVLILRNPTTGQVFIHVLDGWVGAASLAGPWAVAKKLPSDAEKVAKEVAKTGAADLMLGPEDPKTKERPSLAAGMPLIVVSETPTEVIHFDGRANWTSIEGTNLLYVKNTSANVFRDTGSQRVYVLISGRWFASTSLDGPWTYLAGTELPSDFSKIPDSSPKENVKASIPGTRQAQEAIISAEIPQTATVYLDKAQFKPALNDAPILKPIEGTNLQYVFNSPDPIIQVAPTQWFAVQNGVWFTATSIQGPWFVAKAVPADVYAIPVSSPVHYVTYVRVYTVTPTYVVVGYTPGYMGAVVTPAGVVVYGTGYAYPPYVGVTVWYPPPVTYGYAVNVTYTPWTGWTFGFMAVGYPGWYAPPPYWGPVPYRGVAYGPNGAAAWGPGGWAATTGNVYSRWGPTTAVTRTSAGYNAWTGNAWATQAGRSYNSVTGQRSAGQRGSVQNVYTGNYAYGGRGATYNPTTGVGAAGSKVTVGNQYTGNQATAGRGVVSGPGGTTTVAGVKGEQGSVVRVGDSYYGTKGGNVYKSSGQGGFEQVTPKSGTSSAASNTTSKSLQQQQSARSTGEQRAASAKSANGGWGQQRSSSNNAGAARSRKR